jgi:F-type H+-transporting ATPase subunit b
MTSLRKQFSPFWVPAAALYTQAFFVAPVLAAEGGEAKPGLPQLDVSLFPAQLFWLAITFSLLYVMMHFVALPGVKRTQGKRRTIIATELAAATAANESAKAMIMQYEKALADARANAQATVSEILAATARDAAVKQAAQHKELARHLHDAEAKIAASRDIAIAEMKTSAVDLAKNIVEKIAGLAVQVKA